MRYLTVIAVLTLLPGAAPITPNEPIESLWEKFGRSPRPEKGYVDILDDHLGPSLWESAHARRPLS